MTKEIIIKYDCQYSFTFTLIHSHIQAAPIFALGFRYNFISLNFVSHINIPVINTTAFNSYWAFRALILSLLRSIVRPHLADRLAAACQRATSSWCKLLGQNNFSLKFAYYFRFDEQHCFRLFQSGAISHDFIYSWWFDIYDLFFTVASLEVAEMKPQPLSSPASAWTHVVPIFPHSLLKKFLPISCRALPA
jgi:hypothetical protein